MTTLLLATLLTVKFPGGTPNEFATILLESTKQNVVISQGEGRRIPPAEFETRDLDEMSRAIRTQTSHAMLPGSDMVFSDQMLAKRLVSGRQVRFRGGEQTGMYEVQVELAVSQAGTFAAEAQQPELPPNFIALPASANKNGRISIRTEKADALQPTMLGGGLTKPIKVHWIYEGTPVYAYVSDMPEVDFVRWVAKAIGAKFDNGAKEYGFELDPVEIKKRAVAAIKAMPAVGGRQKDDDAISEKGKTFRVAAINALTSAQLSAALKEQGSSIDIPMAPQSPLARLAVQRIRDLEAYQKGLTDDSRGPRSAIGLLQRVDNSRPAMMTVDSRFNVRMEIPVVDQNGRSAGSVRIQ
jgi:hypothetical protein